MKNVQSKFFVKISKNVKIFLGFLPGMAVAFLTLKRNILKVEMTFDHERSSIDH